MHKITRFDPFGEIVSFRRGMDHFFDDAWVRPMRWRHYTGEPLGVKVDLHQTDDTLFVTASLPGVKPEDVEVTITGQILSISGELKAEEQVEREQYLYRERRTGAFARQLELPVRVEGDKADATFENGLLRLSIPKAEEVKPRQIEVKVPTA